MKKALIAVGCCLVALVIASALFCSSVGLPETCVLQGLAASDASSMVKPTSYHGCQITQHVATLHDVEPLFPILSVVDGGDKYVHYSTSTARTMVCDEKLRDLGRHLIEFRLTAYIRTHYSRDERKTLFLNRMYFGGQIVGITDAAQFYFHRPISQLDTAQAALLLGLVRSPNAYSPIKHPDRALNRRNNILDQLENNRVLSHSDALAAKSEPLLPPSS